MYITYLCIYVLLDISYDKTGTDLGANFIQEVQAL